MTGSTNMKHVKTFEEILHECQDQNLTSTARFAREDRLATCSSPSQSGVRVTGSTKVAPDEYGTANMVHIRQSRPGSSPEFQVKIVETVEVVPPLPKSGRLATCSPPSRSGERVTGSTKVAPDEAR